MVILIGWLAVQFALADPQPKTKVTKGLLVMKLIDANNIVDIMTMGSYLYVYVR